MRELKFRGIRIDNGEWVYGWIVNNKNADYAIQLKMSWQLYKVDPETVGQFTGLQDSKGVDIYEGDLMKWDEKEWGEPFTETVEWDYGLFDTRKHDWPQWCEVIGNIHEAKE